MKAGEPPSEALRWVVEAVGRGATIQAVQPLAGATSSTLHSLEVAYRGRSLKLVLRQFTNEEWLGEEPGLAAHEAANLKKVAAAAVATPELIAYDETGKQSGCGVPAILMTQLPGSVELMPADFDNWLYRMAEVLIPIHALEADTYPWRYAPYNDIARLAVPAWSEVPGLWAKAIEIVAGPRPPTRQCFIHRDYHPNNILWQAGRISGVVDWPNACRGAANIDVAWCRGNLAGLYGVAAADRFLDFYRSLSGPSFDYHPYWDLIVAIEILPGPPDVYSGWIAHGVRHLTDDIVRQREDEYLASLMARL